LWTNSDRRFGDDVSLDLRNCVLGHVNHVAGTKFGVFLQVFVIQHPLYVQSVNNDRLVRSFAVKQQNVGVFCSLGETASQRNRLCYGHWPTKVELAGSFHLTADNKVRLLKILGNDRNRGRMQNILITGADRLIELFQGEALYIKVASLAQRNEAVWLHIHRLIEFGAVFEVHIEDVSSPQQVPGMPLLKTRGLSVTVKQEALERFTTEKIEVHR